MATLKGPLCKGPFMSKLVPSSVVSRIVCLCLFMTFVAVSAVGGLNYLYLRNDIMHTAREDARSAVRTMSLLYELGLKGSKTEVKDGVAVRVVQGETALEGHDLVDRTASAINGVATIFEKKGADYVRISTNVKTEKGERAVGTKLAADHPAQSLLARGEAYFGPAFLFGKDFMTGYFPITDAQNAVTGVLFIGIPMEVYYANISNTAFIVILSSAIGMVVVGLAGFYAMRRLLKPLGILTGTVRTLAEGNDSVAIPYVGKSNEFGNIARALEIFRDAGREKKRIEGRSAEERAEAEAERRRNDDEKQRVDRQIDVAVNELAAALARLAQGDLCKTIETPFSGRLEQLRSDFNNSIVRLRDTMSQIRSSTLAIQRNSSELSQSSNELARRTETQAASLEETAAAVDEITVTVRSSAERAREANRAVTETKASADNSGTVVNNAVAAMGRIEDASGKIESIIEVIDDIAFQTNLLALNAGIEAARAGEAGKGFAVVAQEVRELAQRSAGAAKEIKDLIHQSTREVSSGAGLVQEAGEVLAAISVQITNISKHVDTIATASQDQSAALQDINTSVNRMDQMTQQNGAMVEETSEASRALASEANALLELVQQFKTEAGYSQNQRGAAISRAA
jgi:Methyl-accepting chemotaxis protein